MTKDQKLSFSEQERQRIADAVGAAESRTSGEIVPLIVETSDPYFHVDLIAGLIGEIILLILGIWIFPEAGYGTTSLLLVFGFAAGFLLSGRVPEVKRFILGRKVAEVEVRQRALQAFVEHNLMRTRDRTGILIMVSLLERRIEVLADEGINARVDKNTWDGVVSLVLDGIRKGSVIDGLVSGIGKCGEILEKEFPKKSDDTNEIADSLLVE